MNDVNNNLGIEGPGHLPSSPEAAILVGSLFCRLGGHLLIDYDGKRQLSVPTAGAFDPIEGQWDIYPAPVPDAEPTERFICGDQFEGAMRMIVALMNRLHPDDRTLLYDAFGHAVTTRPS